MNVTALRVFFTWILLFAGISAVQARELPNFIDLVEDNHRAVVNISTTRAAKSGSSLPPGFEIPDLGNTPFDDLLRKFFDERGGPPTPDQDQAASLGSGFIISRDGYVLTNNHVIDGADEIIVRLYDRRQLVAELIGTDQRSDIALLKIDADSLPVVAIGESEQLKVGEWVLAIGSPFGFDHSVTAGIVSAKGRSLPSENYTPFIQTDVAINPGNSGGPLFNLEGEVVGINSQIYSRTGGFMGLSFAIPIELAMNVVAQLKDDGRVTRGWLGVIIQEVTRNLAESFDMDRAHGALITQILPDSPAQNSDLQVGDVIVAFNGSIVERSSSLPPLVGRSLVDKKARVEVVRDGKRKTLHVEIGKLPDQVTVGPGTTRDQTRDTSTINLDKLGVAITRLTSVQRESLDIPKGGVVVSKLESGPAQQAGVLLGDVIISIDNEQLEGPGHTKDIIQDIEPGRTVAVLVRREQGPIFLAIKIPG